MLVAELKKAIREVPDFPRQGITFYDLSTLFRDGAAFQSAIERMVARFQGQPIDALAGVEARGFVIAASMAYALRTGLILVRKVGRLPAETERESYTLEYGEAQIEIHRDAVQEGQRIVVVDDLLATGGTAAAVGRLVARLGGRLEGYAFLVELGFLKGREQLGRSDVFSLLHY